jgi:acyl-CoA reductase-like NAD-dependent aldehyde dehydrogenase
MQIVQQEIFGPVLLILPFDTEDEVVRRANNTSYGLAAGLYSNCVKKTHRIAAQLEAGTVFVNTCKYLAYLLNCNLFLDNDTMVHVPFGGYKNSGHGRENSVECLKAFFQIKSIYVNYGDAVQHNLD